MQKYLDFEKPIADLEGRIEELRKHGHDKANVADEIPRLEVRANDLIKDTYQRLSRWQKTQVARHPQRPHFSDYVRHLVEDFTPLAADRAFGEDAAAEAVEVLAGLPWKVLYPKHIAVYLTGELRGWTAPKDVILYVAGELTVAGGTNAVLEYIGPGARTISATGKATITNMGAELGATTSMFPYDAQMATYLRATGLADLVPLAEQYQHLLAPDAEVEANPAAYYDSVITLDLSKLEPYMVGPHSPDRARPISRLAAEVANPSNAFRDDISAALIGSCTNSSYEDMCRAADVAEQAKALGIKAAVAFLVGR